jgi:cell division protein FtsW (lipid II flippase)
MKALFWLGFLGLLLFEIANVYFIMPMPGSQQTNSIDLAYFLYRWRWAFRILFLLMLIVGLFRSQWRRKWLLAIPVIILLVVVYMANFKMAADHMFYQAKRVLMVDAAENKVDSGRLVIGGKDQ